MIKTLALLISLTVVCSQPVFAQLSNPLEQLSAGNFEAVENTYSALQTRFERGLATEYDLLDAYKVFYQRDDRYTEQLTNWIKHYPQSASAYLARGVYYRKLGEFRRGTSYISQVPIDNVKYMEQMFVLSKKDLQTALRLNPKSYLAILHLLNIAQFEGDDRAATKYLVLGNVVLPSNFIVRARYLIHLAPKWGGSYTSMENFIDECRSQGLSPQKVDMLMAIKLDDQGMSAQERGQMGQARLAYVNALILSRSAGERFRHSYLQYSLQICRGSDSDKEYCH